MKPIKALLLLIIFLGVWVSSQAFENPKQSSLGDIDAQIEALKSATPKERVEMMNALKKRVFRMNQEQQKAAIAKIRKKMHAKAGIKMENSKNHTAQTEVKMRGMTQEHQIQSHEQRSHMEYMLQTKHAKRENRLMQDNKEKMHGGNGRGNGSMGH